MDRDARTEWREDDLLLDEVRLHYRRAGSGSPVLLLHGLSDAGTTWQHVAAVLAEEHDVVILDQRGHGQSCAPEAGYAIDDFVQDAAGAVTALDLAPAAVVGHSLGGLIGLYLAATHPHLVSRLVLEDPPLLTDWLVEGASPEEVDAARRAWFTSVIELRGLSPEQRLSYIQQRSPRWSPEEHPAWVESKMCLSPRLWESGGVDLRGDWQAALRRIQCPVLLIRGDAELGSLVNLAREREVMSLVRGGRATHIGGASHAIHKDALSDFLAALVPFLEE